ncbi:MAG: hypothetical protein CMK09_17435 [Ponticaulis sp.]|nr:hypothetical protein [Ponticaulis sp.]
MYVTAQRREEDLNDIAVAVTVLDDEKRDRMGIRTIEDFANFTPGMNFSTSLDRISIRGVGRLTNIIGSDPGVATYNDGFYTASSAEASKTPMFVERVEILRGPQGTLYGRNSVGGAMDVVSKRPTQEFNATYSWLDTEITETDRTFNDPATSAPTLVDLKGNRLPRTSENQFALSTLIDVPMEEGSLFLAGSYVYRDSFYSSIFNTPISESPSFDRVVFRATYIVPDGNVTVIAFMRNAFDELGYDGVANSTGSGSTGSGSTGFGRIESYTTPGTYGVEVQLKF